MLATFNPRTDIDLQAAIDCQQNAYYIDNLACEDEMMERTVEFLIDLRWRTAEVISWAACGVELARRPMSIPEARKAWASLAADGDYRVRK